MSQRDADLLLYRLRHEAVGWHFRLLLKHGQTFVAEPLPAGYEVMQERCCYLNAYTLAAADPGLTYFEGQGCLVGDKGLSLAHAWCVAADGTVIDPTWWGLRTPPAAYLGVPIPLDVAKPHAYEYSRGTFDWWLLNRPDVETELPRLLGLEPV